VEELFLKKRGFHPLQVVGMEGFFGVIFMSVFSEQAMLPIECQVVFSEPGGLKMNMEMKSTNLTTHGFKLG